MWNSHQSKMKTFYWEGRQDGCTGASRIVCHATPNAWQI
eukprot:Gb_00804 [translate_table: standard]